MTLAVRIEHARDCLERRVRLDTGEPLSPKVDLVAFERGLDNTPAEHFRYQQLQSEAHALGHITTEDAIVIYAALGEAPDASGWAAGTDLATKLIVTEALGELVSRRIRS